MEIWYVFASIVLLVVLISWGKVQPFLAFLVASSVAAVLLVVIFAAMAGYGLFLKLFGVIGWREAVAAIRQNRTA